MPIRFNDRSNPFTEGVSPSIEKQSNFRSINVERQKAEMQIEIIEKFKRQTL